MESDLLDRPDIDLLLDALGDPMRRRILGRLAEGPLDVGALAEGMPIGRTAVSMHLRVLKDAGLVADEREGTRRRYHLQADAFRAVRDHLDWYWERSLDAFKIAAETRAKELKMPKLLEDVIVAKEVTVEAPLAVAFEVFIEQTWWPVTTHHIASTPGVATVLEPFVGGRWYERDADGIETDWGVVMAWQPPHRIVLTWQVNAQWGYEVDPLLGSEIEVTFTPQGENSTRVALVHRRLERYGVETERMVSILDAKGGEPLEAYARYIAGRSS